MDVTLFSIFVLTIGAMIGMILSLLIVAVYQHNNKKTEDLNVLLEDIEETLSDIYRK